MQESNPSIISRGTNPSWVSLLTPEGTGGRPALPLAKRSFISIKTLGKAGRAKIQAPGPTAKQNTPPGSIRGENDFQALREFL